MTTQTIDQFNDDLTPEEEEALRAASEAAAPPPAASEDEDPSAPAGGAAGQKPGEAPVTDQATGDPSGQPPQNPTAEADDAAKDDFAAFVAKHKDRSPEDLLRLAFQKEKGRRAAAYDAKQARETVTQLRDGLQQRMADLRQRQESDAAKFKARLAEDPDAAVTEAFEATQQRERELAEAEAFQSYVAQQTEITRQIIPRFDDVAPEMLQFGIDRIGYDEMGLRNAHDARDMMCLYMASRFDKLVQAGVVDMEGRVLQQAAPSPVRQPPVATRTPPTTLSAIPGNGGGGSKSLKDQASDLLNMSEADFEKAAESGLLDLTLRSLAGGGQ